MTQKDRIHIQGELQLAIMRVMWRLEEASVEEVSQALPRSQRGAYTTTQTVLNRLAERGLLERARHGKTIRYTPRVKEADYLSRSLQDTLSKASPGARQAALTRLLGELDPGDLREIEEIAQEVSSRRSGGPR